MGREERREKKGCGGMGRRYKKDGGGREKKGWGGRRRRGMRRAKWKGRSYEARDSVHTHISWSLAWKSSGVVHCSSVCLAATR